MNILAILWNELLIIWLGAELTHSLDVLNPDLDRIGRQIDEIHAAKNRRPAGLTAWIEARRLARARRPS